MAVDIYGENQGFPKEVVVPISQNITSPKDVQSPIYQAVYTNPYAAHVPGLRLFEIGEGARNHPCYRPRDKDGRRPMGLLTIQAIAKDTKVIEYTGLWVDQLPEDTAYTIAFHNVYLDAREFGNIARFANDPSAKDPDYRRDANCQLLDDEAGRLVLEAVRDIRPYEEIVWLYAHDREDEFGLCFESLKELQEAFENQKN